MEEKEIIRSKPQRNNIFIIVCGICYVAVILALALFITNHGIQEFDSWRKMSKNGTQSYIAHLSHEFHVKWADKEDIIRYKSVLVMLFCSIAGTFFLICYLKIKNYIVVTNKRVYGVAGFQKRVDLPVDSISAISTGVSNSIAVATSSGVIRFADVDKRDEILKAISELINDRQATKNNSENTDKSDVSELKKYKELLDMGAITQEEFDAKKKELLGL